MSYFSHHPEAYDEILAKGIARKMTSYVGLDCPPTKESPRGEEDSRTVFEAFILNLQLDSSPVMRRLYGTLIEWAQAEINDEEQAYWERFIP